MKLAAAIDLLLTLIAQTQRVSSVIAQARAEGRETLSEDDIAELRATNDEARQELEAAIETARAEGR